MFGSAAEKETQSTVLTPGGCPSPFFSVLSQSSHSRQVYCACRRRRFVVDHSVIELVMLEITAEKDARSVLVVITHALACVGLFSIPCNRHAIPLPMDIVCHACELGDNLRMQRIDDPERWSEAGQT